MTASGRVLIEGHNLTIASGTGIATYARNLRSAVSAAGYRTDLLVGTTRGYDKKDPQLSEISYFDAEKKDNLGSAIAAAWRKLTVTPGAAKPFALPNTGLVLGQASGQLSQFERVLATPHLLEKERAYFQRYNRRLPLRLDYKPTLFHATRPAPIQVPGVPNIYTLHDIVPIRLPYTTMDDKKFHLRMIRTLCRHADHIVTVSEYSKQDIIRLTGMDEKRITNTYQAVSIPSALLERSDDEIANEIDALFGLEMREYFLFVGAIEPKKNVSRLIDAYAASGINKPLVIAGGLGWMYENDVKKIDSDRFLSYEIDGSRIRPKRRVQQLSYLPLEHLASLIRGARALLFPSVYEGFGLPVVEAMILGTPVMTSNVSSLPEIAGEAALTIDPYDVGAMSKAIRKLDEDQDLRCDLAAKGTRRAEAFSADLYAKKIGSLYRGLV